MESWSSSDPSEAIRTEVPCQAKHQAIQRSRQSGVTGERLGVVFPKVRGRSSPSPCTRSSWAPKLLLDPRLIDADHVRDTMVHRVHGSMAPMAMHRPVTMTPAHDVHGSIPLYS
jgi:hypothetical protein